MSTRLTFVLLALLLFIVNVNQVNGQDSDNDFAVIGMANGISTTDSAEFDTSTDGDDGSSTTLFETSSTELTGDGDSIEMSSTESADGDSFEVSSTETDESDESDDSDDSDDEESNDDTSTDGDDDDDDDTSTDADSVEDDDDDNDEAIILECASQQTEDDCRSVRDEDDNELCNLAGDDDDDEDDDINCVAVVRRAGINGNGDFDDGYAAATNVAKSESSQLYTIIGVLGGIIGALIITVAVGAYLFYQKTKKISMKNDEQGAVEMNQMIDANVDNQRAVAMTQSIDVQENGELIDNLHHL